MNSHNKNNTKKENNNNTNNLNNIKSSSSISQEIYNFNELIENEKEYIVLSKIKKDPEALLDYANSSEAREEVKSKMNDSSSASTIVGATKEDLKRLGLDNPNETVNLAKKAAEKGGKLNMEDMMKLHGF